MGATKPKNGEAVPPENTPDAAGTLEILSTRHLKALTREPQARLSQVAWILTRRMVSVPNGAKKHKVEAIYTKLCVKASGAGDSDDEEEDDGKRPGFGNAFWWNHWEDRFEREPWAPDPPNDWRIEYIHNAPSQELGCMHGGQLAFYYSAEKDPWWFEAKWSKYHSDVHVASLEFRSFREHCYLFQYEDVQYLALNSQWHNSSRAPQDEEYAVTPRPPITLIRFPAPGVFESATMETATNHVALTVVDTARLHFKVLRYTAQAPNVECPTMYDLVERVYEGALAAGENWETHLKLKELLAAYKSMFEGPARDNAQPTREGVLMTSSLRSRVRTVLLRWINGFLRRRARRELAAAATMGALKRKREATTAAPEGDDYGFAF